MNPARRRLLGLAALVVGALALTALFAVLPVRAWFASLAERLAVLGLAGAVVFGLVYVAAALVLVPASILSFVAGLAYGPGGLVLAWCAMMATALLTRPLARRWLAPAVRDAVERRRELAAIVAVIGEEGWRMVLLVRVSGIVPFGLQNYVLGVADLRTLPYLCATAIGVLPSILLYGGAGVVQRRALVEGLDQPGALAVPVLAVLAGITLVATTARKVRRKLRAVPSR